MPSPQIENGYTQIANEIVEKFCHYRISGEEWLVLWVIIRKTYGWKKKEDHISLSQFADMTGLKRQTVLRAINKLSSKKIIAVIKNDDSQINLYRFNKDFAQWKPLSKKITVSSKKITPVIKKDNQVSSFLSHTKETLTKETIQKKYNPVFLQFYDAYPNQKEKKSAWKTWQKLKKENQLPDIDIIIQAIEKQKKWRAEANGEFRPEWKHPATWLNKGCWEDETTTQEGADKSCLYE